MLPGQIANCFLLLEAAGSCAADASAQAPSHFKVAFTSGSGQSQIWITKIRNLKSPEIMYFYDQIHENQSMYGTLPSANHQGITASGHRLEQSWLKF